MAQLLAPPIMAPLQDVNMDQSEKKDLDVKIQSCPVQFYNVFRREAYRLPQMSPNYVKEITVVKGDWVTVGSEKKVVYYPEGQDVNRRTEWFRDKLVYSNESVNLVAFQVLEGEIMKNYNIFIAQLVVQCNSARWTVVYDKCSPEPDSYLELLDKISKNVDNYLCSN